MLNGIAGDSVKRWICGYGGDKAAVETDRLPIVIYVADGGLNKILIGVVVDGLLQMPLKTNMSR